MNEPVTFICTSSNRFDLLVRTLDSFLALNPYPIARYIINEDSGNAECHKKITDRYGHLFQIILNPQRQGLSTAIDNLIRLADTEYIFHCEDDWLFYGNRHFMEQSLTVLQHSPQIHQVWIRDSKDHEHPLGPVKIINGVRCREVSKGYQKHWSGFSTNPGLRRLSDLKRLFPNGLKEYGDEIECSKRANTFGYNAVALEESSVRHIGWGRHTAQFKV